MTEICRLRATLGDLQAKLVTGTSDNTSPAVPVSADLKSVAVLQIVRVINTAGSNNASPSVQGVNGVNGCTISVCNVVNSVINQVTNSGCYGNVNVTSEIHATSAELCGLTLPTFSTVQSKFLFASLVTMTSTSVSDS